MRKYITILEGLGVAIIMLLLLPIFCVLWISAAVTALCGDVRATSWCIDTVEDIWMRALLLILL